MNCSLFPSDQSIHVSQASFLPVEPMPSAPSPTPASPRSTSAHVTLATSWWEATTATRSMSV